MQDPVERVALLTLKCKSTEILVKTLLSWGINVVQHYEDPGTAPYASFEQGYDVVVIWDDFAGNREETLLLLQTIRKQGYIGPIIGVALTESEMKLRANGCNFVVHARSNPEYEERFQQELLDLIPLVIAARVQR